MICENPKIFLKDKTGTMYRCSPESYLLLICDGKNGYAPWVVHGGYEVIQVPCGKCLLCRTAEYKDWALRCWLEAREYDNNQFITLTYDEENEPKRGVRRAEITRFMHNIREHFRRKHKHTGIRFYAAAEYGTENCRAHYHILLFNCPSFGDEKKYTTTQRKHTLYTSETLSHLWGKGFCAIGAVTRQSCDYVARFRLKNFYRKLPEHLNKEFHCMSTQKGIGYDFLVRNLDRIIAEDTIHVTGGIKAKLPRFYDRKIIEIIGQERFDKEIAIPRTERARAFVEDEMLRTGLPKMLVICHRIEQEQAKANELIKKFKKTGD